MKVITLFIAANLQFNDQTIKLLLQRNEELLHWLLMKMQPIHFIFLAIHRHRKAQSLILRSCLRPYTVIKLQKRKQKFKLTYLGFRRVVLPTPIIDMNDTKTHCIQVCFTADRSDESCSQSHYGRNPHETEISHKVCVVDQKEIKCALETSNRTLGFREQ